MDDEELMNKSIFQLFGKRVEGALDFQYVYSRNPAEHTVFHSETDEKS